MTSLKFSVLFTAALFSAASCLEVVLNAAHNYKLNYDIINSTSSNPILNATLSITGIDTSNWVADGRGGMYLGLGFGGKTMRNIDAIVCLYYYNNRTNDTFVCGDTYFDGSRTPLTTVEQQDAKNVKNGAINVKSGTFAVSFQRVFNTSSPATDYVLTLGDTDFIWSYGRIAGGVAVQHSDDGSGTVSFNVGTGQVLASSFAAYFTNSVVTLCSVALILFAYML